MQPELDFDYESKRDRWNGYDPEEHQRIHEEFARIEEVCIICKKGVSDCCLAPTQQFFSYIMAKTS